MASEVSPHRGVAGKLFFHAWHMYVSVYVCIHHMFTRNKYVRVALFQYIGLM